MCQHYLASLAIYNYNCARQTFTLPYCTGKATGIHQDRPLRNGSIKPFFGNVLVRDTIPKSFYVVVN